MNIAKKNITHVYQKSKNLLVIIINIVKQQRISLYSSFWSRQQTCNRFQITESRIIYLTCSFAKQCSKIDNSSELPLNFLKKTDKSVSAIAFAYDDIATLMKNLDPDKAHGHDRSIHMLKLCCKSICRLFDLIFQSCMKRKISY